ncbi:L-rhamnose mutarotase [Flammeovirga pacifica]|uniref:L-rhamnose mutarotase n=1 Tax=Flammeovirga pacifica TaxID=915059 RepID=A0A1S1Z0A5_FLAPC|nr:L-rhamnose mutarotase [Flammeovirga pacifica]OHX66613.1 L-rhamnose mutarotase [Flammeovirga pacifica]
MHYKRYCKTLSLSDNKTLIEDYKKVHAKGFAWKEITQGMKDVGILDMEIYLHKTQLFMIMDTVADFDHEVQMKILATKPRQSEWEKFVSRFQVADENADADSKWELMERIYELDQKEDHEPLDGQVKELSKLSNPQHSIETE